MAKASLREPVLSILSVIVLSIVLGAVTFILMLLVPPLVAGVVVALYMLRWTGIF